MVALRPGSAAFEAAFGAALSEYDTFKSEFPSHQELQNAWLDPSVGASFGLDRFDTTAAHQARDLHTGSRLLLFDLATDFGTEITKFNNYPSGLLGGLKSVIDATPIGTALSERDVADIFDAASKGNAGKVVATVTLGVGLAAVGTAIPVVGQIGAAIAALVTGIVKIIKARKAKQDRHDAAVREAMYRSFPPLQTADSVTDSGLVQNQVRTTLQTQDWTRLFLPRFKGEWVGIERDRGFAFAQGEVDKWSDEFAGDEGEAFVPSGGVGLIPGTTILTSVIQVNLDPRGAAFKAFLNRGSDPRGAYSHSNPVNGAQYIIDTGSFYPATARLAGLAWEWATKPGSPYLYRLDCIRMHAEWLAYCEAGIDYLRERVFPWWGKNLNGDGTIKSRNLEGFFGAAVYYGVGSWACQTLGGTNLHPIYTKFDTPTGYFREEMKTSNLYPGSLYSGPFLPILDTPSKGFQSCMGTIYYRNPAIYDTLNALQKRQRHNLKYSLVSAYVRRSDAAFAGDAGLQSLLDDMRALLLKSEARMAINMLDVPEGERHNGKDWRAQLLASGVPKVPSRFGIHARLSAGDGKPEEPEPDLPPLRVGNPVPPAWDDPPVRRGRQDRDADPAVMGDDPPPLWTRERAMVAGIGGFGALFAAGWALSKVYKRKSGPL
ncbi:hypothetical protein [Nannocystis sp.]|uniref:hypothetical protein n=1 Tax=Nannocystis sp. TaxID=1962667 RepID=UPI0025EA5A69|nr:hypothetical protein [Nannocystis sp.]MBK7830484.1 hypothetical protein [Nannocystis sp.]